VSLATNNAGPVSFKTLPSDVVPGGALNRISYGMVFAPSENGRGAPSTPTRSRRPRNAATALFFEASLEPGEPPLIRRGAAYALLAVVIVALGANWPFLTLALEDIPPIWFTVHRLGGSAIVLTLGMVASGSFTMPPKPDRPLVVGVGVFRLTLVTTMALYALSLVPPGRASILIYTSSLWAVPIAVVFLRERLGLASAVGVGIGMTGLVILLDPSAFDWSDTGTLAGTGLLLLAAVITAAVSVQTRGHRWTASPMQLMPWQVGIGALPVIVLALAAEGPPSFDWRTRTWFIVLYQITIATPFTIWGVQTVLRRVRAITTSLAMTAVPVIGVLSARIVVGEELTARSVSALILITAGVWIGVGAGRRSPTGQRGWTTP